MPQFYYGKQYYDVGEFLSGAQSSESAIARRQDTALREIQEKSEKNLEEALGSIEDISQYMSEDELSKLIETTMINTLQDTRDISGLVNEQMRNEMQILEERYSNQERQINEDFNSRGVSGSPAHQAALQRLQQSKEADLSNARLQWQQWGVTTGRQQLLEGLGVAGQYRGQQIAGLADISRQTGDIRGQINYQTFGDFERMVEAYQQPQSPVTASGGGGGTVRYVSGGITGVKLPKKMPKDEFTGFRE